MKVKFEFRNLPLAEKVVRVQQLVASLTNNPDYPTPNPPLAQVTAAANAFQTAMVEAQTLRQAARAKTTEQNEKEAALNQIVTQLLAYIESVGGGNEQLLRNAGVDVRTSSSSSGDLASPTGFSATAGDHDGEIDLHWNRVSHARSYVVERSADPPTDTSWAHERVVTTSSATISGLTRGTKYWFRVAAVGANGQSGWSDPATKIAP